MLGVIAEPRRGNAIGVAPESPHVLIGGVVAAAMELSAGASPLDFVALATSALLCFTTCSCAMASNSAARLSASMRRFSLSISSRRLRFKYSLASSVKSASMGMVNRLNAAWSCKASAFLRFATAICCVAYACACNADSLFANSDAVAFAALLPCGRGGRLKNPSRVKTSTSDPSPVPSVSPFGSNVPSLSPSIAAPQNSSVLPLPFRFPMDAIGLSMAPCRFWTSSGESHHRGTSFSNPQQCKYANAACFGCLSL